MTKDECMERRENRGTIVYNYYTAEKISKWCLEYVYLKHNTDIK